MSCMLEAHRGVGTEAPENTLAALRLAARQGYGMVEIDPRFTSDDVCVLLHDPTVNRTGRLADGTALAEKLPIAEMTFAEARRLDFGLSFSDEYRGERIPSLDEVLSFARETGTLLKFDSVLSRATDRQLGRFFDAVEEARALPYTGFTAFDEAFIRRVQSRFPEASIHYDGPVSSETLRTVSSLVTAEHLTVWMRFDNPETSWNTTEPVHEAAAREIHGLGKLGVWLLRRESERERAVGLYHADVIETDGTLKP